MRGRAVFVSTGMGDSATRRTQGRSWAKDEHGIHGHVWARRWAQVAEACLRGMVFFLVGLVACVVPGRPPPALPETSGAGQRGSAAVEAIVLGGALRSQTTQAAWPLLVSRLTACDVALLGEFHDNAEHHRLQAMMLQEILTAGGRPALVFEMMDIDQQAQVDAITARPGWTAQMVFDATDWVARGWPNIDDYRPLLALASDYRLQVVAGNLSADAMRGLFRDAGEGWSAAERTRMGLVPPLSVRQLAIMQDQLQEMHGGHIKATTLAKMVAIQQARDGQFARLLAEAASRQGAGRAGTPRAVLIAGADHARLDRGVGWHLRRLASGQKVFSVAMVALHPGDAAGADTWWHRHHDAVVWTVPAPVPAALQ